MTMGPVEYLIIGFPGAETDLPRQVPSGREVVGGPSRHANIGWDSFAGWPAWDSYTHQSVHRVWLERAWRGGMG